MGELATVTFTVRGRLPTQNELVGLNAQSHHLYNRRKKQGHDMVYLAATGIKTTFRRVEVALLLLEPNMNFDPDNIACGALKVILDGLQRCGVLMNDGWADISGISFSWVLDSGGPAVRVSITGEVNGNTSPRERRIELGRREHRQKAARAKKAAQRAQHHSVHGKPAQSARDAGSKAARARIPNRRS